MKKVKNSIDKELIIETALNLIEVNKGIRNVNFRGIAKEIGCAHTNLYNYFDSFDQIIWESLGQVILRMFDYVDQHQNQQAQGEEKIISVFSAIIDFSLEHPGWFELLWLEEIEGEPSDEVKDILYKPALLLNQLISQERLSGISEEKAGKIANIIFSYLHGELCRYMKNRNMTINQEQIRAELLSNIRLLYRLLSNY